MDDSSYIRHEVHGCVIEGALRTDSFTITKTTGGMVGRCNGMGNAIHMAKDSTKAVTVTEPTPRPPRKKPDKND